MAERTKRVSATSLGRSRQPVALARRNVHFGEAPDDDTENGGDTTDVDFEVTDEYKLELIKEIEKTPGLYDKNHADYCMGPGCVAHRAPRQALFREVAAKIGSGSGATAEHWWRNLRSYFTRAFNKSGRCQFYEELKFVLPHIEPPRVAYHPGAPKPATDKMKTQTSAPPMSETSGRNSAEKCGVDKMEPATGNSKADASTPRVVTLSQDMRLARENVDSENLENTTAGPKRSFRMSATTSSINSADEHGPAKRSKDGEEKKEMVESILNGLRGGLYTLNPPQLITASMALQNVVSNAQKKHP